MRIRQIKPAFWSDAGLARLPLATRLFYVGTWCLADDAGWFDDNVPEIAHALLGYDAREDREASVVVMLAELVAADRVVDHHCGHLEVPRMPGHQHLAGQTKRVHTTFDDHLRRCIPAETRGNPRDPALVMVSKGLGNGQERVRLGKSTARATASGARSEDGEPTEFERKIIAAGGPAR